MTILMVVIVAGLYVYGSQVNKIEVTQVSAAQRSDGLVKRLLSREKPSLRVLLTVGERKIYSNIEELNGYESIVLTLNESISPNELSTLELHDARLSAAGDLIVVGQVLERFDQPKPQDMGSRFRYKFKSRWGF